MLAPPPPLIAAADRHLFAQVNRQPFAFAHALHERLPLTLDDLVALGRRLPDGPAFKSWQNGRVAVDAGWATRPADRLSFDRTVEGIAGNDSLVVLKHVEQDPIFGPVLQDLLQEIFAAAPAPFRDDVMLGECLIFLNSPHRTTAYHFDLEPSFLLQIAGEKSVSAWPSGDPTLVPDSELEDYCGAGNLSAARYKPERQAEAFAVQLRPGDGVHFPSTGPHWVKNGAEVAISVNVNFDLRSQHCRRKYAYAVNTRMRKLGLSPRAPGVSRVGDGIKIATWRAARGTTQVVRRLLGRRRNGEGYPVWRPAR